MIFGRTFKLKKMLFPDDEAILRINQFNSWKEVVKNKPHKYRIRMIKIKSLDGKDVGVAFALEKFIFLRVHIQYLWQPSAISKKLARGYSSYKSEPLKDWTIVEFTDLWPAID